MKEHTKISPELEKEIGDIVDEDIQKVIEEEGTIEKDVSLFGLKMNNILGLKSRKRKRL